MANKKVKKGQKVRYRNSHRIGNNAHRIVNLRGRGNLHDEQSDEASENGEAQDDVQHAAIPIQEILPPEDVQQGTPPQVIPVVPPIGCSTPHQVVEQLSPTRAPNSTRGSRSPFLPQRSECSALLRLSKQSLQISS